MVEKHDAHDLSSWWLTVVALHPRSEKLSIECITYMNIILLFVPKTRISIQPVAAIDVDGSDKIATTLSPHVDAKAKVRHTSAEAISFNLTQDFVLIFLLLLVASHPAIVTFEDYFLVTRAMAPLIFSRTPPTPSGAPDYEPKSIECFFRNGFSSRAHAVFSPVFSEHEFWTSKAFSEIAQHVCFSCDAQCALWQHVSIDTDYYYQVLS